jgi:hypothetical protein
VIERKIMPYIPQDDRSNLDEAIESMVAALKTEAPDVLKRPGPTTYTITRIVAGDQRENQVICSFDH